MLVWKKPDGHRWRSTKSASRKRKIRESRRWLGGEGLGGETDRRMRELLRWLKGVWGRGGKRGSEHR